MTSDQHLTVGWMGKWEWCFSVLVSKGRQAVSFRTKPLNWSQMVA